MMACLTASVFFFEMSLSPVTQTESVSVRKQHINEQTAHLFIEAMPTPLSQRSEPAEVLLGHFECKTLKIIDAIAAKKVEILSGTTERQPSCHKTRRENAGKLSAIEKKLSAHSL